MGLDARQDPMWESYWDAGPPLGDERHFIIRSFLPLTRAIARRLKAGLPASVDYDDLVSAGVIGLISAVDRFDPDKGHNFKKYAAIRIRGTMLDELRQMDWAPRSVRRDEGQLVQTRKELEHELGRKPTHEEIAARLGLDSEKYSRLVKRLAPQTIIRLEDMGVRGEEARQSAYSFLKDPSSPDPLEESVLRDAYRVMVAAIDNLKERQRQVISLYYFDNLNLKEIAAVFGVTESRISQIHSEAIGVLKKRLADHF